MHLNTAFTVLTVLTAEAFGRFAVPPVAWLREHGSSLSGTRSLALENAKRDINPAKLYPTHKFPTPVDHFHNESLYEPHSNEKFGLRYWFDASHYKPGGPVIILEGGETDGSERLPYLQKGILAQLAEATNGVGVVIEHRYYGGSFPTPNLSIENLRFLTTDQALVDTVYFAQNIVFPGWEHHNLTASAVPWIAYGGSYAGAFVAFLRTLYPGVFFGAISSSGVTEAIYDYWKYYEPIKQYGPPDCIKTTQELIHVFDTIMIKHAGTPLVDRLKTVFGLGSLTYATDFANALTYGIGFWQELNWDPAVSYPDFNNYCDALSNMSIIHPATKSKEAEVKSLFKAAGFSDLIPGYTNKWLNWIGFVKTELIDSCSGTLDECYSTHNQTFYDQDDLAQNVWRSWPYQYCSYWGYLQTGSGVPADQLPLISRTIDLEYSTIVCRDAFKINHPPDTEAINSRGGFKIKYPRLAIIGGQWDPWRQTTPLADTEEPFPKSTTNEPIILIPKAIHHWDENGLFPNQTTATLPPPSIKKAQAEEIAFVKEWLKEAAQHYPSYQGTTQGANQISELASVEEWVF